MEADIVEWIDGGTDYTCATKGKEGKMVRGRCGCRSCACLHSKDKMERMGSAIQLYVMSKENVVFKVS